MPALSDICITGACLSASTACMNATMASVVDAADASSTCTAPAPDAPSIWSIPAVWGEPEELSAAEVLQEAPQAVRAETTPSTQWGSALVSRLSSGLVRDRNRFVCMQLATMASEQLEKVQRARNEGDGAALRHARSVFLSTLEVGGELVGAALHYPRAASKRSPKSNVSGSGGDCGSGSSMGDLFPHVYVELICINRPGKGYGSLLLQHVEAFALSNAVPLLRAALQDGTPGTPAAAITTAAAAACTPSGDVPIAAAVVGGAAAASQCPPECTTCLRGIKLLSVESAQRFYAANGYSEPDEAKEMTKALGNVRRGLMVA